MFWVVMYNVFLNPGCGEKESMSNTALETGLCGWKTHRKESELHNDQLPDHGKFHNFWGLRFLICKLGDKDRSCLGLRNQDGGVGRHTAPPRTTRTDRKSNGKEVQHQGNKYTFIQTGRRGGDGQLGRRGLTLPWRDRDWRSVGRMGQAV